LSTAADAYTSEVLERREMVPLGSLGGERRTPGGAAVGEEVSAGLPMRSMPVVWIEASSGVDFEGGKEKPEERDAELRGWRYSKGALRRDSRGVETEMRVSKEASCSTGISTL
jgi:hypothetical protein